MAASTLRDVKGLLIAVAGVLVVAAMLLVARTSEAEPSDGLGPTTSIGVHH